MTTDPTRPLLQFKHQFVEFVPEELSEGVLYVSMRFASVAHLCACGCKSKVVTPLKPDDWKLTFDGKAITLYPSIGNQTFSCGSHYWIEKSRVKWVPEPSRAERDSRYRDVRGRDKGKSASPTRPSAGSMADEQELPEKKRWWNRIWKR